MAIKKLGKYELVEEIGRGGMATVYRAYHPAMERYVAVKVLPEQFTHDSSFTSRFRREARIIARLEHPNILPVYDFGQEGHTPYIVMRLLEHGSLRETLEGGPLRLAPVVRIFSQICPALDYAHTEGIVHRDLKPANLMLDQHGLVYLTDFGLAQMSEATGQHTGSGLIGTPAYLAPELAQSGAVTPAADIYALGVMLYQMLVGVVPYRGPTPIAQIMKHLQAPIPSLRETNPAFDPRLDEVVQKAMAKVPEERYETSGAMLRALLKVSRNLGVSHTHGPVRLRGVTGTGPLENNAISSATQTIPDDRGGQALYLYRKAEAAQSRGDLRRALEMVEQATTLEPTEMRYPEKAGEIRRLLAQRGQIVETHHALSEGDLTHAQAMAERLLKEAPNDPAVQALAGDVEHAVALADLRRDGRMAVANEHWAEAVVAYEELLVRLPDDSGVRRALSNARRALAGTEDREVLFKRAQEATRNQEWVQARSLLETLLSRWPDDEKARILLSHVRGEASTAARIAQLYDEGLQAQEAGLWQAAVNALNAVMSIDPYYKDVTRHFERAQQELIQARRAAQVEQQRQRDEWYERARQAIVRADWFAVREAADALTSLDPNEAQAFLAQAKVRDQLYQEAVNYANQGNWVEARLALRTVLQQWPTDQEAIDRLDRVEQARDQAVKLAVFYDEAMQALTDGRWKEAIAALEKVLSLDTNYRDVHRKLEDAQAALTAAQKQAANDEQATRIAKLHTGELYLHAEDALEVGDWKTAIVCLIQVLERDPAYADATSLLVYARQQQMMQETKLSPLTETYLQEREHKKTWLVVVGVALLVIVIVVLTIVLTRTAV